MAGYSGTPLARKLGVRAGHTVVVLGAPEGFVTLLREGEFPEDAVLHTAAEKQPADVVVFFTKSESELRRAIARLEKSITPAGGLWIAWPKRASGVTTDMTEDLVRDVALPRGLVDNKVCAIDETWSALRLVVRREHRSKR